jgi:hypothetical protein
MNCVASRSHGPVSVHAGSGGYSEPVIIDRDNEAMVVVVHFRRPPRLGDRFTMDGLIWEIVRPKSHQRGFVARPICSQSRPR